MEHQILMKAKEEILALRLEEKKKKYEKQLITFCRVIHKM